MTDMIRKELLGFEMKAHEEDRSVTFTASDENVVDRDKEIVKIKGMNIDRFKQNPVLLFGHQHHTLPIGKVTKIWKTKDGRLKGQAQFPEMEVSGFSDTVYKLIKGGYLNMLSIGFLPGAEKDAIEYPQNDKVWRIFNKSELLEISIVPVGSNPNAIIESKSIQKAIADKVIDDMELTDLKITLEELLQEKEPEKIEEDDSFEAAKKSGAEKIIEKVIYVYKCNVCGHDTDVVCEKCNSIESYFDELILDLRAAKSNRESTMDEMIELLKNMNK